MLLLLLGLCATAVAAPSNARVVLADPDPELRHALATALSPWDLEIVVEATRPGDATQAEALATREAARFVVWRRDGDLVVFDRERGSAEHREGRVGPLDPVAAAAAALTVKTLMRLPPPVEPSPPMRAEAGVTVARQVSASGSEVRVQLGASARIARGSSTDLGARAIGAALLRPWLQRRWHFGIAGELGTETAIQRSGFKGAWNDWAVFALASWSLSRGPWAFEPHAAVGLTRSSFDGIENGMTRSESSTRVALRGGVWVRRRLDARWSIGGSLELDTTVRPPAYGKLVGNGEVFAVPDVAVSPGVFVAADVGR